VPITVRIEGERGSPISETWWHPASTVVLVGNHPGTCCLRFMDPYGDAVFNQVQLPVLLEELRALRRSLQNSDHTTMVDDLCKFIEVALDQDHTYVRFLGD
jgi:hypothetical protein